MKNKLILIALLLSSSVAHAATYSYTCNFTKGDDGIGRVLSVTFIDGKKMEMTAVEDENGGSTGDVYHGKLDVNYNPSRNKDSVRFYLKDWGNEYTPDMIVQKTLLKGGIVLKSGEKGGVMKYQARGEGYFSGSYLCVRK